MIDMVGTVGHGFNMEGGLLRKKPSDLLQKTEPDHLPDAITVWLRIVENVRVRDS